MFDILLDLGTELGIWGGVAANETEEMAGGIVGSLFFFGWLLWINILQPVRYGINLANHLLTGELYRSLVGLFSVDPDCFSFDFDLDLDLYPTQDHAENHLKNQ